MCGRAGSQRWIWRLLLLEALRAAGVALGAAGVGAILAAEAAHCFNPWPVPMQSQISSTQRPMAGLALA